MVEEMAALVLITHYERIIREDWCVKWENTVNN